MAIFVTFKSSCKITLIENMKAHQKEKLLLMSFKPHVSRHDGQTQRRHFDNGPPGRHWNFAAPFLRVVVWPKCLRWGEGEEPEAQASLPSHLTRGPGLPVCHIVLWETGQGGGHALPNPNLQTQHHRVLLRPEGWCPADSRSELHRLFLC